MKNIRCFFIIVICFVNVNLAFTQTKYYDASEFPLIGKLSDSTETRYERLPAYLQKVTRPRLWELGKNTSGLALRFNSNSTSISVRWNLLGDVEMNHMTMTGIKGLDLYTWNGEKWQFVNSARPTKKNNEEVIIENMFPEEREYLLFLPLYDGVTQLAIGIDSLAYIQSPKFDYPCRKNPIVCYGTSITQGGCANRAGMSYTNILTRHLNREFINLGFSGNGKLDYEIAEIMSHRTDAGMFILDFIPNVTLEQVKEKTIPFVERLRRQNPQLPILFIESIIFPHSVYDKKMSKTVLDKNDALKKEFQKLVALGYKNIYYLPSDNLIGSDGEATVDGIHFTDLGFVRFAGVLETEITQILNKERIE